MMIVVMQYGMLEGLACSRVGSHDSLVFVYVTIQSGSHDSLVFVYVRVGSHDSLVFVYVTIQSGSHDVLTGVCICNPEWVT